MRKLFLFPILTSLTLTGCNSLKGFSHDGYSSRPLVSAESNEANFNILSTPSEKIIKSAQSEEILDKDCIEKKDNNPSKSCMIARNRITASLISESIQICAQHLNGIYGNEAAFNISSGGLATLSSAFAAISSGGTASLLSAISTTASGGRALVNETVYKNMITTAVATKITEDRQQRANEILSKSQKPTSEYPIESAIIDALRFHESCSFRNGLELALKEGTQTTKETKISQSKARLLQIENEIQAYQKANNITPDQFKIDQTDAASTKNIINGLSDPILRLKYQTLLQEHEYLNSLGMGPTN